MTSFKSYSRHEIENSVFGFKNRKQEVIRSMPEILLTDREREILSMWEIAKKYV